MTDPTIAMSMFLIMIIVVFRHLQMLLSCRFLNVLNFSLKLMLL